MTRHLHRARLFLSTVAYLQPAQIKARLHRQIRRRVWKLISRRSMADHAPEVRRTKSLLIGIADAVAKPELRAQVDAAVQRAIRIADGEFTFLNRTERFNTEPAWHDPSLSQLWRYQLHYFEWIADLLLWAEAGFRSRAYETFRKQATSWIARNSRIAGDGWHPYTISLRLVNWVQAVEFFWEDLNQDSHHREMLLRSMLRQAEVLRSDLELDVRGNHLMENLRALIWVAHFFQVPNAGEWLRTGLALLHREVVEQALPDGGHFERSPGYHFLMLKDLLEIAVFMERNGTSVPDVLTSAIRRMCSYGMAILGPGNEVPLLKDTALNLAPEPMPVLRAACLLTNSTPPEDSDGIDLYSVMVFGPAAFNQPVREPPLGAAPASHLFVESGHFVWRAKNRQDCLILDVGKPCPDYLPAHAHADMFTYELWVDGEKFISDSGVFEYAAGIWRDYFRSTRAHNTIEVDGLNQSEVWASFRVGRRARPRNVRWQTMENRTMVQAEHDGYRRDGMGVVHRRTVSIGEHGIWVVLDELTGSRSIEARSYLHFDPVVQLEQCERDLWRLVRGKAEIWLKVFNFDSVLRLDGSVEPRIEGWHSSECGRRQAAPTLVFVTRRDLPICFGYILSREPRAVIRSRPESQNCGPIEIEYGHHRSRINPTAFTWQ